MDWTYLVLAGLLEIGFTTSLKLSGGFKNIAWSIAFLAFGAASFGLLSKAMQTIPLGTAYAIWTGMGAAGTVVVGIVFFKEPVTFGRLFFVLLLIGSVIGLRLVSKT